MTQAALKQSTPPSFKEPAVTPELAKQFGLSEVEYQQVLDICGRTPQLYRAWHLLSHVVGNIVRTNHRAFI